MQLRWLVVVAVSTAVGSSISLALLWFTSGTREQTEEGKNSGRQARLGAMLRLLPTPQWLLARTTRADSRLLRHAGLKWSAEQFASLRWGLFCTLFGLALLAAWSRGWDLMGTFLAALLVMIGVSGPGLWLRGRVEARSAEIDRMLPDFIDRLALGLEAGLGFEPVLRRIARNFPGLLGSELDILICQLDLGHPRGVALQSFAKRNPSPRVAAFVTAVRQSDRLGTSLARVLKVQSELLRAYRRRQAEEAGRRLPILIVFPLVFFLLPALLIVYLAPPLLHLILGR